ncbi:MAG: manganese-binding transcriptional regulator MntR [Phycisphaerae bacterium]|nr:manganese-binding transcriptional regulator MntR [Phycisphaerae bacterium]
MSRATTKAAKRSTVSSPREHSVVRDQHALETAEDYCEAIADLIAAGGEARVVGLTRRFGVSHVTVSRVVARLQREGFLRTQPYQPIELTPRGRRLAADSRARHQAVFAFLLALGVDEATARIDAEGIEHHVSPATLRAFARFVSRSGGAGRQ